MMAGAVGPSFDGVLGTLRGLPVIGGFMPGGGGSEAGGDKGTVSTL